MSRTLQQLVIDIETILECDHGSVTVRENFDEYALDVEVDRTVVEDSMFDEEQIHHIVDSLTPNLTAISVEVQ